MAVGFDQKAARAAGRVEDRFADLRADDVHHESHHRARRVYLARIAGGVAQVAQQGFVQSAEGMDFVRRIKVDAVDQADDVAEQIAALHAVGQPLEHGGDDIAAFAPGVAAQAAQVGEQAGAVGIVGQGGAFVGQEGEQVRTGEAVERGGPIPPAVGRFDDAAVFPPGQFGALRLDALQVVQEFQEHDPGQHRQAVEVAVQPRAID